MSLAKPILAHNNNAPLIGTINLPGDKSISHRAIMFGALASGTTLVKGLLEGEDVLASVNAMVQLGAKITKIDDIYHIEGVGEKGLLKSKETIDFGNAGTGVRLLMGIMSAYNFTTRFSGDASLSSRPMGRVLDPLKEIGVEIIEQQSGKLPIAIRGPKNPAAINYLVPVASAQVKSAVLLAGLRSKHKTIVIEKVKTRDHSEKMLLAFGADLEVSTEQNGFIKIEMQPKPSLKGQKINVPGDPSSAAFAIVAALIVPDSDIEIKNVLMNPTRVGLITSLKEMGADIKISNLHISAGEEIADLRVRYSKLTGIDVPAKRAPLMIDEYPILAVAAANAKGTTNMAGIGEMRIKETDRLSLMAKGLRANGINCTEGSDFLTVEGAEEIEGGAFIKTHLDHRIAMTFLVLGMVTKKPIKIDDASVIATSYPDFIKDFTSLGAKFEYLEQQ